MVMKHAESVQCVDICILIFFLSIGHLSTICYNFQHFSSTLTYDFLLIIDKLLFEKISNKNFRKIWNQSKIIIDIIKTTYVNTVDWQSNVIQQFMKIFDNIACTEKDHHLFVSVLLQKRIQDQESPFSRTNEITLKHK